MSQCPSSDQLSLGVLSVLKAEALKCISAPQVTKCLQDPKCPSAYQIPIKWLLALQVS